MKRLSKRMKKYNDPDATVSLGRFYHIGLNSLDVDQCRAFELIRRASEIRSAIVHYDLGNLYQKGET